MSNFWCEYGSLLWLERPKEIFDWSKFKVTRDISPTISGWLLVYHSYRQLRFLQKTLQEVEMDVSLSCVCDVCRKVVSSGGVGIPEDIDTSHVHTYQIYRGMSPTTSNRLEVLTVR